MWKFTQLPCMLQEVWVSQFPPSSHAIHRTSTKRLSGMEKATGAPKVDVQEKPFECTRCGKRFGQLCMLKIPQRIHTGQRPYKCSQCGLSFRWRRNPIALQSKNPLQCSVCDETFISEASLKKHQDVFHSGVSHTYSLCLKTFTQAAGLRKHVQYVHEGERAHKCSECGRGFVKLSNLTHHQRRYHYDRGDQLFQCSQCEQSFSHQDIKVQSIRLPVFCLIKNECFTEGKDLPVSKEVVKVTVGVGSFMFSYKHPIVVFVAYKNSLFFVYKQD
ncbi:hypothetical protein cypCar_00040403 [Cyprinus carpio]|nr:hypothetical protein cypCar_00040403 [Cyprinus carpio]